MINGFGQFPRSRFNTTFELGTINGPWLFREQEEANGPWLFREQEEARQSKYLPPILLTLLIFFHKNT